MDPPFAGVLLRGVVLRGVLSGVLLRGVLPWGELRGDEDCWLGGLCGVLLPRGVRGLRGVCRLGLSAE